MVLRVTSCKTKKWVIVLDQDMRLMSANIWLDESQADFQILPVCLASFRKHERGPKSCQMTLVTDWITGSRLAQVYGEDTESLKNPFKVETWSVISHVTARASTWDTRKLNIILCCFFSFAPIDQKISPCACRYSIKRVEGTFPDRDIH